jgi:putative tryptophan/tyrosine transport system substrate-binding protein
VRTTDLIQNNCAFWRFPSPRQAHAFSKPNPRKPAFPHIDPANCKTHFWNTARQRRCRAGGSRTGVADVAVRPYYRERESCKGRNVSIEYRWAQSRSDQLASLALELVHRQVAAIAAAGTASALAATAATTRIPVVFSTASDPVAIGLVANLNRPGGNVTGVTNLGTELVQKELEMLHRMVPSATITTALINPAFPLSKPQSRDLDVAARKLGLELHVLHASSERDLDDAFAKMLELRAGALVVPPDAFFLSRHEQIVRLATRHSVPTIFPWRDGAIAGGLMPHEL